MSELIAEKRDILGKKVQNLREAGRLPAELYGYGVDNMHISVATDAFEKLYKEAGSNTIVDIVVGGEKHKVLIQDVHTHPISQELLNIDFYQVNMKEEVTASIPLEFVGESPAEKDLDGVLITQMDEIEVSALPTDLPHSIEVDLSVLTELDTGLTVADLPKKDTYTYIPEEDTAIVNVSTPREEVEEEPVDELSVDDIVVEGEEKRDADGDESGGDGASGNEEDQGNDKKA